MPCKNETSLFSPSMRGCLFGPLGAPTANRVVLEVAAGCPWVVESGCHRVSLISLCIWWVGRLGPGGRIFAWGSLSARRGGECEGSVYIMNAQTRLCEQIRVGPPRMGFGSPDPTSWRQQPSASRCMVCVQVICAMSVTPSRISAPLFSASALFQRVCEASGPVGAEMGLQRGQHTHGPAWVLLLDGKHVWIGFPTFPLVP